METKHTKGPWVVDSFTSLDQITRFGTIITGHDRKPFLFVEQNEPELRQPDDPVDVPDDEYDIDFTPKEFESNVILMDAAPDLLEACKMAILCVQNSHVIDFISKAIAKAEGR